MGKSALMLCATASIASLLTSSEAIAQVAANPPVPRTANEASAIADIVVTAQRRSESIQKVPLSVSAVSGEQLATANITTALDLNKLVPSVNLVAQNNSVLPFIRGVGNTLTPPGNESSVSIYVDDVYYGRIIPVLLQLNNVEQIEVLKGPQGTLFGRNSTGGLVHVKTRTPRPGQDPTASAQIGYGNFNTFDASAYAAVSIGDKAAIDISGIVHHQADGWGRNYTTGADSFAEKSEGFRSKLVVDVTDDTRFMLTGEYAHTNSNIGINASPFAFSKTPSGTLDPTPGRQILTVPTPYDSRSNQTPIGRSRLYAASARVSHDFGFATVSNIAAWKRIRQFERIDLDFNAPDLLAADLPGRDREFTNEFQISSNGNSRLKWTAGLFYINMTQGFYPASFYGAVIGSQLGVPTATNFQLSVVSVKAVSLYGQATYEIVDDLKLTLGGRYSWDKLKGAGEQSIQVPGGPVTPIPGTMFVDKTTVKKPSFRVALDYSLNPDVLVYGSVSQGFKEPVYNVLPFSPPPTKPEVLTAYEVGLKSEFLDRRLKFNAAAFWYEIKNPQVQTAPRPGSAVTSNAEHARHRGFEIETTFAVTPEFQLRAAGTYLDAKYTSFRNASIINPNPNFPFGNLPGVPGDVSGSTTVFAPKLSGNAGADYTVQLGNGGEIVASGNVLFTSKVFFEPDHNLVQPAYALVDASLTYKFPDDKTFVRLWGANLTDKLYYRSASSVGYFGGNVGTPGAPRTYGVTIGTTF